MKRLIMCEGPNELAVMKILLENNALIFTEDDLLGLTPYHARQIETNTQVQSQLNIYSQNDVLIMRIGDKQMDVLRIPKNYKKKIIGIEKYCTLPELEMLLIISEGMVRKFEKKKSSIAPKQFAKSNIRYNRKRYNNSSQFFADYYGKDCGNLIHAIREYKRIKGSHEDDQLYLADLLK